MIFAYLRVSTGEQDVKNQKLGIKEYCKARNIKVDEFIEDVISGSRNWKERRLGQIIKYAGESDIVIFSEVSRIGRSTLQCLQFLEAASEKGITIHIAKQQIIFDNSLNSKIIATTLALASEIEREFISMRTKEALRKRKEEGVILGRPKGVTSINKKLSERHKDIQKLVENGVSYAAIGRLIGADRKTVSRYVKRQLLE